VEVNPSNQNFFGGQLQKRAKLLSFLKKAVDLGAFSERDVFDRKLSCNLP
jgi:hypothetical protein